MWIPFDKKISAAFESDRHLVIKLLFGALVGLAVGANLLVSWWISADAQDSPPVFYLWLFVGSVSLTISLVLVLTVKDAIRKRANAGHPVNPLLRLLFISGYLSLTLWIAVALVGSLLLAIWSVG